MPGHLCLGKDGISPKGPERESPFPKTAEQSQAQLAHTGPTLPEYCPKVSPQVLYPNPVRWVLRLIPLDKGMPPSQWISPATCTGSSSSSSTVTGVLGPRLVSPGQLLSCRVAGGVAVDRGVALAGEWAEAAGVGSISSGTALGAHVVSKDGAQYPACLVLEHVGLVDGPGLAVVFAERAQAFWSW